MLYVVTLFILCMGFWNESFQETTSLRLWGSGKIYVQTSLVKFHWWVWCCCSSNMLVYFYDYEFGYRQKYWWEYHICVRPVQLRTSHAWSTTINSSNNQTVNVSWRLQVDRIYKLSLRLTEVSIDKDIKGMWNIILGSPSLYAILSLCRTILSYKNTKLT